MLEWIASTTAEEPENGLSGSLPVKIEHFSFGHICIDGKDYDHDVVIDHGKVSRRKKKPSKAFREEYGHTPLSGRRRHSLGLPSSRDRDRRLWIASRHGRRGAGSSEAGC
jgi:hypothetical protein